MLSRQKRDFFKQRGRSNATIIENHTAIDGQTNNSNNEDSGLSAHSADSPTQSPPQRLPEKPAKCALMDDHQWAALNEQIKQICLDCSKQFGGKPSPAASSSMNLAQTVVQQRQQLQLPPQPNPPNPPKKSTFSLPKLFLPRAKEKPPKNRANLDQEQHSPTTTSAYGTGGTDTTCEGQESPDVEKAKAKAAGSGVEQQKEKQRAQTQKSVKFDTSSLPPSSSSHSHMTQTQQKQKESAQLPGGVFYTSAERLAETLELQQRLLRQELMKQRDSGTSQQKAQERPPKAPLIRVPASPVRTPANLPTFGQNFSSFGRGATASPALPNPPQNIASLMARPPSVPPQLVAPPNSPQSALLPSAARAQQVQQQQQMPVKQPTVASVVQVKKNLPPVYNQQQQLRTTMPAPNLDNIFAYKPQTKTSNVNVGNETIQERKNEAIQERQSRVAYSIRHQQPRKSKSPPKQLQPELEWVVKRRPDGTRYVTRRPARKQKQPSLSAIVKARREQSLLRERHQSGAASTTTDDDGATGSELAHASRLWMREQRRRHKGRGAEGLRRAYRDQWTAEQSDNYAQQQQQVLPRLNTELRMEQLQSGSAAPFYAHATHSHQQQTGGTVRGHSLPGQAIFSVTTV